LILSAEAGHDTRRGRILIVDDKADNIRLLTRLLSRGGYESVEGTTDPERVSELYAAFKPDLVLLDLRMPGRDGFAVLRELEPYTRGDEHLPVLMLTGEDTPDVKRQALALGAKEFVGKPFDTVEVLLRIQNLLETRFLHQSLHQHNVLWRPEPGEWVAIDPKPMAADPLLGLAPALWNQWPEAVSAGSTRVHLRRRLDVLCERAGLDRDRADAFALVRLVRNAVWDLQAPSPRTRDDITQIVTIMKALQPA
jgi:CheY-like chemotaxis protein